MIRTVALGAFMILCVYTGPSSQRTTPSSHLSLPVNPVIYTDDHNTQVDRLHMGSSFSRVENGNARLSSTNPLKTFPYLRIKQRPNPYHNLRTQRELNPSRYNWTERQLLRTKRQFDPFLQPGNDFRPLDPRYKSHGNHQLMHDTSFNLPLSGARPRKPAMGPLFTDKSYTVNALSQPATSPVNVAIVGRRIGITPDRKETPLSLLNEGGTLSTSNRNVQKPNTVVDIIDRRGELPSRVIDAVINRTPGIAAPLSESRHINAVSNRYNQLRKSTPVSLHHQRHSNTNLYNRGSNPSSVHKSSTSVNSPLTPLNGNTRRNVFDPRSNLPNRSFHRLTQHLPQLLEDITLQQRLRKMLNSPGSASKQPTLLSKAADQQLSLLTTISNEARSVAPPKFRHIRTSTTPSYLTGKPSNQLTTSQLLQFILKYLAKSAKGEKNITTTRATNKISTSKTDPATQSLRGIGVYQNSSSSPKSIAKKKTAYAIPKDATQQKLLLMMLLRRFGLVALPVKIGGVNQLLQGNSGTLADPIDAPLGASQRAGEAVPTTINPTTTPFNTSPPPKISSKPPPKSLSKLGLPLDFMNFLGLHDYYMYSPVEQTVTNIMATSGTTRVPTTIAPTTLNPMQLMSLQATIHERPCGRNRTETHYHTPRLERFQQPQVSAMLPSSCSCHPCSDCEMRPPGSIAIADVECASKQGSKYCCCCEGP